MLFDGLYPEHPITHVGGPLDGLTVLMVLLSPSDMPEAGKMSYRQVSRAEILRCVDRPGAVPTEYGFHATAYRYSDPGTLEFVGFVFRAFPVLDQAYDDPACQWRAVDVAFNGVSGVAELQRAVARALSGDEDREAELARLN